MRVAGRYRVVCRKDHAVPDYPVRSMTGRGMLLDVRIWCGKNESMPLLLVNASRRQGHAVQRNQFRRRVRMAFLEILRSAPELTPLSGIVWVRPSKGLKLGEAFSYGEIMKQITLALRRWIKT